MPTRSVICLHDDQNGCDATDATSDTGLIRVEVCHDDVTMAAPSNPRLVGLIQQEPHHAVGTNQPTRSCINAPTRSWAMSA